MKDNILFQYIRNVVKEKQNTSKNTEPTTFAQRYCKQQLIKKKLNSYNPHEKMTHLMKNFRDLDTYVDLPELISSIKKWKFREMKSLQSPNQSFILKQQKNDQTLHKKIKKELGQKIKQKYLNQNSQADEVLKFLQRNTTIRSDGLKNNSYSDLNLLFQEVQQQGSDQTWKGSFDFLELLHKAQDLQNIKIEEKSIMKSEDKIKDSQLNSKFKRQYTNLLHKITTYLQIILQTQHKQKWDNKQQGHKLQHLLPIDQKKYKRVQNKISPKNNLLQKLIEQNYRDSQIAEQKNNFQCQTFRQNRLKKIPILHRKNVSQTSEMLRGTSSNFKISNSHFNNEIQEKPFLKQQFYKSSSKFQKNLIEPNFTRSLYQETQQNKQNMMGKRNDSFYRETSSFKFRTQATLDQFPPERRKQKYNSLIKQSANSKQANEHKKLKQLVKQNFTFRNRNIKQKIVNKISNFIRQIDEQEHNNKKQNNYYNKAINKLQNTMSLSFDQFRQQALAGDADIQTLKKYANFYNSNGLNTSINVNYFTQLIRLTEGGLFNQNILISSGVQKNNVNQNLSSDGFETTFNNTGTIQV